MNTIRRFWWCAVAAFAVSVPMVFARTGDIRWSVALEPPGSNVLQVRVDTTPLPSNVLVTKAVFVVQLYNDRHELIAEREFNFLGGEKLRVMEGGQVFERHFPFDLQSVGFCRKEYFPIVRSG